MPAGGLKLSSKLLAALSILQAVPPDEKAIVFSWFKGALDLLEAVIHQRLRWPTSRIDGDFNSESRWKTLQRFTGGTGGRVLLITLSTGGVGLNLNVANQCATGSHPPTSESCSSLALDLLTQRSWSRDPPP